MTTDPLPSWNEGDTKRAILAFVQRVSAADSRDFVPREERIAVFDNDGTLWCEKPLPIQADFLLRRLGEMARERPSLRKKQPWKSVVDRDYRWLGEVITKHYRGDDADLKVMAKGLLQAYAGMTIDAFDAEAGVFLETADHPTLGRRYRECVYRPMVELLRFLEEHGFTNHLVSGGGRDFMRLVTERLYGIPPERVIGSAVALEYVDEGTHTSIKLKAAADIFDDGPTKPLRIWSRIGRRPIFAGGNSNGDFEMLRFCADAGRPSFGLLLNHDDGGREFTYSAGAERVLEQAAKEGWTVVSMKDAWSEVFVAPRTSPFASDDDDDEDRRPALH